MYFDYEEIFDLFNNTFFWAVKRDDGPDIAINNETIGEDVSVEKNKDGLVVSVKRDKQASLLGLEITGNAPITEKTLMTCTVYYQKLHEDLSITEYSFRRK